MAISYTVKAQIVDIAADKPKPEDAFLVDTNVWLWMTYPNAGHNAPGWAGSVMPSYANYVNSAVSVNAKTHWCGLSLAELAHVIERIEREIFESAQGKVNPKKAFRHNFVGERARVVSHAKAAWHQVKSLAEPLTATIDESATDAALARVTTELVDGYDLFILEAMSANGVAQIITDDGDFSTVPGIQVFTANKSVISAAKAQGVLMIR